MKTKTSHVAVDQPPSYKWRRISTSLFLLVFLLSSVAAQQSFLTSRGDTTRSGANTNETILTPSNVNSGSFGHLFSVPIDYQALAQPLYVPDVNIGGQIHNVIYVVTQADSAYAIDADNGGTPLWHASLLDGGVPATGASYLPCGTLGGFDQEGIVGTPVIDPNTNTMYLVAKSVANATVRHFLHILDIATGLDVAPPVQIAASSVSMKGTKMVFNSLHQKNRPGALLLGNILYLGFGSNGCNDHNSGWVLAYDVSNQQSIQQIGVFNTSPDVGLTSIWQTGNGLAADEFGNLYVSTAESANYDVPTGGQSYCNSILKLSPAPWTPSPSQPQLADYFTPSEVAFLNAHDQDVSSVGPVVLPDLPGPYPHEVIGSSKQGLVWVLNRDDMGWYSPVSDNVIQEFSLKVSGELMCSPAYWNGTVYFMPDGEPLQAFQVTNGIWSPSAQTSKNYNGASSPAISSNGNSNGIVWQISGTLNAFDAVSLKLLYTSSAKLPKIAHFATPTVINGKVYVATQTSLEAYGLLNALSITGGNNQTGPVGQALPQPLQIVATSTGQPVAGVTLSFSDGGQGGSFNPPTATTGANGSGSTVFTLPPTAGTYTLTVSAANFASVTATETATPAQKLLSVSSGNNQTGQAGQALPQPLQVVATSNSQAAAGVTLTFSDGGSGGSFNPPTAVTGSNGSASSVYTLPPTAGTYTLTVSAPKFTSATATETATSSAQAKLVIVSGANQTGVGGAVLANPLVVEAEDAHKNPVAGVTVQFTPVSQGVTNPASAVTNSKGLAQTYFQLPVASGTFAVSASASGSKSVTFSETSSAGTPAAVTVSGGNNQSQPVSTTLRTQLTVVVTDISGTPVPNVAVTFSDNGAGGNFSAKNPVYTDNTGTAAQSYTLPATAGTVKITATVSGVTTPAIFSEFAE